MQKATYYDSSAIYSGYPYQSANGLGYDANQQQYLPALHVERDYHRPACSLQSPAGSATLHKPSEIAEGCLQSKRTQATPTLDADQNPTVSARVSSPDALTQNSCNGPSAKNPGHGSPSSATRKQIFPWMKESRQNTKQKSSSTSSGDYKHWLERNNKTAHKPRHLKSTMGTVLKQPVKIIFLALENHRINSAHSLHVSPELTSILCCIKVVDVCKGL